MVGQTFRFDLDDAKGDNTRVKLPHPEIIGASEVGHTLLIDDGKVKMTVINKGRDYLECRVDVPGMIKDRKGVNTPDSVLNISPLTPKDRSDLEYMLQIGVDWVALSFVQTPGDIEEIHALIDEKLPPDAFRPSVMAKIEKPSCFYGDNLKQIVALCNGIMVARGDLGVECAPEDVPILQKTIIDECRSQGKPVIVATQMLESMIESPTPTRAEASDVSTAIVSVILPRCFCRRRLDSYLAALTHPFVNVLTFAVRRSRCYYAFCRKCRRSLPRGVRRHATANHQPCRK